MLVRCLSAMIIVLAAAFAQAANLDVYILTGQSNSLGTTNLEGAGFDPGALNRCKQRVGR